MLTGLYAKLIGLGLSLAALAGLCLWCHHAGAASVQARWDASKAAQAVVVAKAQAANAEQTLAWTHQFAAIDAHYEAVTHEPTPAVADSVASAAAAGTVRLRDEPAPTCPGAVPDASARARAADAAATAALAQRIQDSIAAVRVGDAADAREQQLRSQVIALQSILRAERATGHPAVP